MLPEVNVSIDSLLKSSSSSKSPTSYRSSSAPGVFLQGPSSSTSSLPVSPNCDNDDGPPPRRHADRHLKTPKTFYPLCYSRKLRDMEIWTNKFLELATGCPTVTPLELVPINPLMLDLGCGYGFWCIQAAGFFQNCRVVGLDIADIQPSLQRLGYPELSNKISWVHGDMLERLPFPDNHFDFVRTMHTEYCVPEHKWGKLFEEVSRVLKPGGIFESIQEALIFPCPRFSPRIRPPKNVAAVAELSVDESPSAQFSISKEVADTDPRDHSRLKAAFDAMVEVRFLNPQIISTLPFYMELQFDIVNMTSIFHVMLPPSSFVRDRDDPTSGAATEPKGLAEQQINVRGMLQMEPHASSQEVISDQGGEMHLNHTLNTILSCKEAIREQFEVLNPTLKRIDFDFLMKNWELDMRDRIDMRTLLREGLLWDCPTDNGDPEERFWREETLRFHQEDGLWDAQPIPQPCRSIRAYRGIKRR